jgi:P27 family predicted phage terminase small subunit
MKRSLHEGNAMPRKLQPFTAAGAREITGRPLVDVPERPALLTPPAAEKFSTVARYLTSLGALTDGEVDLVVQYAAASGRFVQAEEAMAAADGLHYRVLNDRTGQPASAVASPAQMQSAKAVDQMRRLASSLGLTPTDRAKLPALREPGPPDEMELLLARHEAERARAAG